MAEQLPQIEAQVSKVADRLAAEFADSVPAGVVRNLVTDAYQPLRDARATQFVPVLVDRTVRRQLRRGA